MNWTIMMEPNGARSARRLAHDVQMVAVEFVPIGAQFARAVWEIHYTSGVFAARGDATTLEAAMAAADEKVREWELAGVLS